MKRWPTKRLGDLVDFLGGGTPRRDRPEYWGGDIPWASVKDLQSQSLETTMETITSEGLANSASHLIPEGTVIIASRVGLGKVAINQKPVAINQDLKALTPRTGNLHPRYLLRFLHSKADYFERAGVGATVKGLTIADYQRLDIALPPMDEQERIVNLLDEADQLRKLRAQADSRTNALIPALFHKMFGDPARNEMGWPIKPFGELANNQDGRRKPVKASDRAERKGDYPYYGASGIIDYVEEYLFDETALLIGEDGANLLARSTPIAFLAHGKYWVNNHAHVVTDNGNADLDYLGATLNLRDISDYVTGSAQPKLNQANLNRMAIPVPPLPLQKEFAERVSEIRELESTQAASCHRLEHLFQSLLYRAFDGGL